MPYNEDEVQIIQKNYGRILSNIPNNLNDIWNPQNNRQEWQCLSTSFLNPIPAFNSYQNLGEGLQNIQNNINANPDINPVEIGHQLFQLSQDNNVGYSIGLNPWADHFMFHLGNQRVSEVIVIVANNWWPLVSNNYVIPFSPLHGYLPEQRWNYIFQPFNKLDIPILYTNRYPYFMSAGKQVTANLDENEIDSIGGVEGMQTCLRNTMEAIDPKIRIRGLVTLGAPAWETFKGFMPNNASKITETVNSFNNHLNGEDNNWGNIFRTFQIDNRNIPWLPHFHPKHRGAVAPRVNSYTNLVNRLLAI